MVDQPKAPCVLLADLVLTGQLDAALVKLIPLHPSPSTGCQSPQAVLTHSTYFCCMCTQVNALPGQPDTRCTHYSKLAAATIADERFHALCCSLKLDDKPFIRERGAPVHLISGEQGTAVWAREYLRRFPAAGILLALLAVCMRISPAGRGMATHSVRRRRPYKHSSTLRRCVAPGCRLRR